MGWGFKKPGKSLEEVLEIIEQETKQEDQKPSKPLNKPEPKALKP